MARYVDKLKVRKMITVEYHGLTFMTYDDYFLGQWVGNINVFDGDQMLLHATLINGSLTKEQLLEYAKEFNGRSYNV